MSLVRLCLCFAIIGLVGCSDKSNSKGSPAPVGPQGNKVDDVASDYTQSATLNLSQTNDQLKNVKDNVISLKGTGTKSTYKISYDFNSGASTSFKVMETSLKSSYSNCSAPQAKIFLKNKTQSREINIVEQYNVEPNTDYVLEVALSNSSCKELEMTFDVLAWVGTPLVEPKTALICESNQVGQTTFIMNVNFVTAFSSVVGKEKFIAMDSYCGESFRGTTTNCSGSANLGLRENGSSWSTVQCSAEKDGEKRNYQVDFNTAEKSAVVSCQANDTQTFSDNLRSCESVIVDYRPYSQLLLK